MAKQQSKAEPILETEPEKSPTRSSSETESTFPPQPDNGTPTETDAQAKYIDPRSEISVSLADYKGGPRMHLMRSHRSKQMQIRFDGEQPAERHLATLKEAGWTDRTEQEGIWTKQVQPGDWRTVVEAERTFKAIADGIRADKGLEPVSLVNEHARG